MDICSLIAANDRVPLIKNENTGCYSVVMEMTDPPTSPKAVLCEDSCDESETEDIVDEHSDDDDDDVEGVSSQLQLLKVWAWDCGCGHCAYNNNHC